ncbi:MAG: hypothetical protein JXA43_01420 [Candidatus Diapherotrites archaeon]|nr:hypothetical protein [Candidatus Diapherotrites archaeon]
MLRKNTIYLSGEADSLENVIPKSYSNFFKREFMFVVLLVLLIALGLTWII